MNRVILSLTLALTACASSPELDTQGFDHSSPPANEAARLAAYTGSECSALTPSAVHDLQDLIEEAYDHAEADSAAHSVTGSYPASAALGFQYIGDARDELDAMVVRMDAWPSTTPTRSAAWQMGQHLKRVIDDLTLASHWGSVSTAWHDSSDARQAVEGSFSAIEEANALRAVALRCYLRTDGL